MTARSLFFISALVLAFSFSTPASAVTVELLFDSNELIKAGKKAIHQGRVEKAVYYYEKALKRGASIGKRDMIHLRSDLCVAYMYMERFEEALRQCKIGLFLMPNRWETLNNLGTLYLLQGDYDNAIIHYRKALKMSPNSSVLNKNWEIVMQRSGAAKEIAPLQGGDNIPGHRFDDDGATGSAVRQ
ncbi:MAG: tetratricopeptide repeat protein [Proteobacteria bacterium]|nr:tetratricopeptide repeat protein [Pseudomonadota bacterium]